MLKRILFIATIISVLFVPSAVASASQKTLPAPIIINSTIIAAWQRVDICENGGNWNHFSYWYPDGLGIDRPNWIKFGGSVKLPSNKFIQIEIATRFIQYYHMNIPDKYGCYQW
jgi:hypothetical protein